MFKTGQDARHPKGSITDGGGGNSLLLPSPAAPPADDQGSHGHPWKAGAAAAAADAKDLPPGHSREEDRGRRRSPSALGLRPGILDLLVFQQGQKIAAGHSYEGSSAASAESEV